MRNATLIRGARQLLTLRGVNGPRRGADLGNLGIIQDGAVLVADGRIVEVGPSRRVENLGSARDAGEIDASGCVVLPGFVACGVRLVSEDHDASPRALKTSAQRLIEDAIRHGVTALEAKAGPGLTESAALKVLRVHATLRELPLTLVSTLVTPDVHLPLLPRLRKLADRIELSGNATPEVELFDPIRAFESNALARWIDRENAVALTSSAAPAAIQTAISLACRVMHLSPAEAICAATINAAHAIGQAHSIGSVEAGKSADLIVLDVSDYRELPYHLGVNRLGVNLVKMVMIRGSVRVERAKVQWPDS